MTWTMDQMTWDILANEGGLVCDKQDTGGMTKYGITLGFAQQHPDFFDLNGDGKVQESDIWCLTPEIARKAYVQFFYMPAKLALLPPSTNCTMQLFDLAVNTGVRYGDGHAEAIKVLQHALGMSVIDGDLGATTLAAFRAALAKDGAVAVNNAITDARIAFYDKVVAAHPTDKKFLAGWINRANKYRVNFSH